MKNINFIILALILCLVSILAFSTYMPARFDIALKNKVSNFPMQVGEWKGTEIPVREEDYKILETRNLFVRQYKNPGGESVFLYVVYSEDNRKVSHPPEICLLGSGVTITDKSPVRIADNINAVKLTVEKKEDRELVVYWYKAGKLYTNSYLKQQSKVAIDRLLGKRTSGALIRLTTGLQDDNEGVSLARIKAFTELIQGPLGQYIP